MYMNMYVHKGVGILYKLFSLNMNLREHITSIFYFGHSNFNIVYT